MIATKITLKIKVNVHFIDRQRPLRVISSGGPMEPQSNTVNLRKYQCVAEHREMSPES